MDATNLWFEAIGLVKFDIHEGQVLDYIYPIEIGEAEKSDLSFLCIPDMGTGKSEKDKQSTLLYHFTVDIKGERLLGWVVYVQKKDEKLNRGAVQRSFFLLSKLPIPGVAHRILKSIAKLYFQKIATLPEEDEGYLSKNVLLNCWHAICAWPEPVCCGRFDLSTPTMKMAYTLPCFRQRGFTGEEGCVRCPHLKGNIEKANPADDASSTSSEEWAVGPRHVETEADPCDVSDLIQKLRMFGGLDGGKNAVLGGSAFEVAQLAVNIAVADSAASDSPKATRVASMLLYPSPTPSPPPSPELLYSPPGCGVKAYPFSEVDIEKSLAPHLPRMWKLWELVITGEPISVLSSTASSASYAVRSLATLIEPLTYVGDVRPYLTLHNTYVDDLTDVGHQSTLLGFSNPIFARTIATLPHVLVINMTDREADWRVRHRNKSKGGTIGRHHFKSNSLFTDHSFAVKTPNSKPEKIKAELRSMTQHFLQPIWKYLKGVINNSGNAIFVGHVWEFFYRLNEDTSPTGLPAPFSVPSLLEAVSQSLKEETHHDMWKKGKDVLAVYIRFIYSASGLRWVSDVYFKAYREFISSADLPTLLLNFPPPPKSQQRLLFLNQVELQYEKELSVPIPDHPFITTLEQLNRLVQTFRERMFNGK